MLIARLLLAVTAPFVSLGQSTNETTLSPKAEAAVQKGLSAAKQQQWTVAIRYFNEARQAAPDSPVPLVNLGLAEAQLSGHELRAICWFEAYLALVPNAVNAPAVHQQVSDLETRAKGNAQKMIEMLKKLAGQVPSTETTYPDLAGLLAKNGDLDSAAQIVQNQSNTSVQSAARWQIVEALIELKRIPDAIKQADQIDNDKGSYYRGLAYHSIFSAQIAAGLLTDAKKIAGESEGDVRLELTEAEYQAGRREDAAALLRDKRALIDKEDPFNRERELAGFAAAEYKIGIHEEADAIFQQIKEYAYHTKGEDKIQRRMLVLIDLAQAENKIGRRSTAVKIMGEAETACRAARSAHEKGGGILPNENHILYGYYSIEDWDRAEEWLHQMRRVDKGLVFYSSEEDAITTAKANMEANHAKAVAIKMLSDANSLRAERAQAWSDYIKACLTAPLFTTDFKVMMAGLVGYTPPADEQVKSHTIFNHVKKPAEDLISRLNDIHELEAKQIKFAEK